MSRRESRLNPDGPAKCPDCGYRSVSTVFALPRCDRCGWCGQVPIREEEL